MQTITAEQIAKNGVSWIAEGKVRNHQLKDHSRIHTGTDEYREYQVYRDFLLSKNCCMILELKGSDY